MMLCCVSVGYQPFGGLWCLHVSKEVLQNVGVLPRHYMVSQPRRSWLEAFG